MAQVFLSSTVRISDDAVFRALDGEGVVLNLTSGIYFGLNPVAARAWQLIEQLGSLEAVRQTLLDEFDVEPDVAARDLLALVTQLADRGLVEVG